MIVANFPAAWKTMITVHRGGLDPKGNPLPSEDHEIGPCLVGWQSTADPLDRSDLTVDRVVAYVNDPMDDIAEGDTVTVPAGPWPSGDFRVDGEPKPCPLGLEVPLRRG